MLSLCYWGNRKIKPADAKYKKSSIFEDFFILNQKAYSSGMGFGGKCSSIGGKGAFGRFLF